MMNTSLTETTFEQSGSNHATMGTAPAEPRPDAGHDGRSDHQIASAFKPALPDHTGATPDVVLLERPTLLGAVRAVGVTFGPSLLLDLIAAAGTIAATRDRFRPPPRRMSRRARLLALTSAALPWVYAFGIRPWHLRWGAAEAEVGMPLPGDDLIPDPAVTSTRAVTVNAPVAEVWPWLAQIGQDRGGFYSYEWLENLAGCRMRNADRIHPEWQYRAVGDIVRLHPSTGVKVVSFEPNHAMVLTGWGAFVVTPRDDRRSRVIVRSRVPHGWAALSYLLFIEIPHFIMERKMLLGLKERAERHAAERPERTVKHNLLRRFNRRFLNPAMLRRAARSNGTYPTLLYHVGRRSGRSYTSPVVAQPVPDGFIIPLPYGTGTDWCQNVLASGRFTIEQAHRRYQVSTPEIISAADALPLVTDRGRRRTWQLFRIKEFLRARQDGPAEAAAAPEALARESDR